jgi:hypothetical protein
MTSAAPIAGPQFGTRVLGQVIVCAEPWIQPAKINALAFVDGHIMALASG